MLDFSDWFVLYYKYELKIIRKGVLNLSILEFLELFGMSYEKFSKDKAKLVAKWTSWEPSFKVTGVGRDAVVSAQSFEVFYFQEHARIYWLISGIIDYRLLYELYKIIIETDGRNLRAYGSIAAELGVHPNTIARYVNLLDSAGIISKQVRYEAQNRRRVKALPMFHDEFKESLLEPATDWYNHQF